MLPLCGSSRTYPHAARDLHLIHAGTSGHASEKIPAPHRRPLKHRVQPVRSLRACSSAKERRPGSSCRHTQQLGQGSPENGKQVLHSLANDPGIVHLIHKYKFKIHRFEELNLKEARARASAHFNSPTIIRGSNKRTPQGNIIKVRLFYDNEDMKTVPQRIRSTLSPRRSFNDMIETLIHELAHQRFEDHSRDFFDFNQELCDQYNSRPDRKATITIIPRTKKTRIMSQVNRNEKVKKTCGLHMHGNRLSPLATPAPFSWVVI